MRLRRQQQDALQDRVLQLLRERAGQQTSYAEIAAVAGVHHRTAISLMQRLEQDGIITKQKTQASEANTYTLEA